MDEIPPPSYWDLKQMEMRRDALLKELATLENVMQKYGVIQMTTAEVRKNYKTPVLATN
jgi:hypothetical protein